MEETASPSVLVRGEPRVVAVQVINLQNGEGSLLLKSLLVPVLETVGQLCKRISKGSGVAEGSGPGHDSIQVFNRNTMEPVASESLVRTLGLTHHDDLLCSVGLVEHQARCMRCKQAPILGTRYHVSGYSVDLCPKHASQAPESIRRLLKPLFVPHVVHDGIVSTHRCPVSYSSAYDWLCSVDGPYSDARQVDEALKQGASLIQEPDGHLVFTWPRDARGALKTGAWPRKSLLNR